MVASGQRVSAIRFGPSTFALAGAVFSRGFPSFFWRGLFLFCFPTALSAFVLGSGQNSKGFPCFSPSSNSWKNRTRSLKGLSAILNPNLNENGGKGKANLLLASLEDPRRNRTVSFPLLSTFRFSSIVWPLPIKRKTQRIPFPISDSHFFSWLMFSFHWQLLSRVIIATLLTFEDV